MGTHVHPWLIHVNVWQNQYSTVKQNEVKIKIFKKKKTPEENTPDPEGLHWCILPDLKDTSMKRSQKADKRARSPPPRGAEAGRAVDAGPLTCVCGEDYIGCRQALQHGCLLPVLQLLPQQLDFISKITLLSLILGLSVFRLQRKGKIIILTRLCF